MKNKIHYILPGFLNFSRNEIILYSIKKFNFIFYNDFNIYSFYDNFPSCIFNGGSVLLGKKYRITQLKKIKKFYYNNKIRITLTMTNPIITKKDCTNEYANQILEIYHSNFTEILISSPILENYIRATYPRFKINRSIIASKTIPYETKGYNLTVLNKRYNNKFNFLKNINNKEKIEVLCDEQCINDCKYSFIHYMEYGKIQSGEKERKMGYGECRYQEDFYRRMYLRNKKSKYYISHKNIHEKYIPLGFKYFKLSGRGKYNPVGTETILEYCVKEIYKYDLLAYIYERMLLDFESDILYAIKNNIDNHSLDI